MRPGLLICLDNYPKRCVKSPLLMYASTNETFLLHLEPYPASPATAGEKSIKEISL
jgi:hypothetical protein